MGYVSPSKDSEYYYGVDSTYQVPSRRKPQEKKQRPRVASPLLVGDPELEGYALGQKRAAPAKPVETPKTYTVAGVTYDTATGRPVNAPEGGYSVTPDGGMTPHSAGELRVNANGLVSYGRDLSSLNAFTKEFTGEEVRDIKATFTSEALPLTEEAARQQGNGSLVTGPDGKPMPMEEGTWDDEAGAIIPPTVPGTTGGKPNNAQDGTSSAPDIAESVRTIRMQRKNARDDGSFRGFQKDNNNRIAQQPQAEAPDPGKVAEQKRRDEIRSTFLDLDTPIIKASIAANAKAGYGKNSDGQAVFNYGGELVQAKEGMQQQAKNAAMMGRDPSEFLQTKIKEVQEKEEDKV